MFGGQALRLRVQVFCRDVDRHESRWTLQRAEQQADFLQRAGAELDQLGLRAYAFGHLGGVLAQDRELGAGGVVLGQLADAVEQRRALTVVEVLGRDPARLTAQTIAQRAVETVGAGFRMLDAGGAHDEAPSRASRKPLNCQRAAGGKKLR